MCIRDRFTGGPGLNGGSHKVGCLTIPTSSGNTERQIMFIKDLNATILCCTPSYAAYIGETMKEMGMSPEEIPLKAGIFGAEDVYKRQAVTVREAVRLCGEEQYRKQGTDS